MRTLYLIWAPHERHSESFARHYGTEIIFVHYFQYMRPIWSPIKYPLMAVKTIIELSKKKPELVFAMTPPLFCVLFVYIYSFFTGAHFIIDSHTGSLISPPWGTVFRSLHRFLCKKAVVTIVTNDHLASVVQSWGGKTLIITPPISFPKVEPCSLKAKKNLLVVNTFSSDEPLLEILQAARMCPEIQFHVSGHLAKASTKTIKESPANVRFTDFIPYSEYFSLLKSVDGIISITTRDHTLQSGGEEALFMGKPLITTRFPYLMKFFNKGTVYVAPTAESIRKGVLELFENKARMTEEMILLRNEHIEEWNRRLSELKAIVSELG